jgi:putative ABC transport system ATP-binding protein
MTLECRDVVVEYSGGGYVVRPIDGLSIHVAKGELALLLGASGCGKTTLLSILAAILRPQRGSVRLNGREVTSLSGGALTEYRRHSVGVVFQSFNLVPSLTAAENVQVPLRAAGLGARRARRRAGDLLRQVGLGQRGLHRPGELSGGEQQRVAIARALALDPPLLLADEPTAHLDYIQIEGVLRLLREIADEGRMVVVATHDERMAPLADRTIELSPRREDGCVRPQVRLAAGEVLFRQGDASDLVYVVEDGCVELLRTRGDGTDELVARHGPGEYFGELGPMFGLRRSATARAAGQAVVAGLPLAEFRSGFRRQDASGPGSVGAEASGGARILLPRCTSTPDPDRPASSWRAEGHEARTS